VKTFTLGPNDALLGSITAVASPGRRPLGALIWGLGVSEVLLARRLARLGIPSIQLRLSGDAFTDSARRNETYDHQGIALCRAAMDRLGQAQGSTRFIGIGNCAAGSLVLNAALADERLVAVVPTNLHFEGLRRPLRARLHRLLSAGTWRRVASGDLPLRRAAARLVDGAVRDSAAEPRSTGGRRGHYDGDIWIGDDFAQRLEQLATRGVRVRLICSRNDDSRYILADRFAAALKRLQADGHVSLRIIERDVHIFSHDETAAQEVNDDVCAWLAAATDLGRADASAAAPLPLAGTT
jgi:hypothetical protein